MDFEFQLKNDLLKLSGKPCWGVTNGHGSWLDFQFGDPRLVIREPLSKATSETLKNSRRVNVVGQYFFWFELCEWSILQDDAHQAHDESEKPEIDKAAALIDGQILTNIHISTETPKMEFTFDLGGKIVIQSYSDSKPDEGMWHFYVGDFVYTLKASGLIEYGKGSDRNPESYRLSEFRVNV